MRNALVDSEAGLVSIAEMARRHQVSLRTLRFYEEMGLLTPKRVNGERVYSAKDGIRLELIAKGKRLGFSLRELDRMIQSHLAENKTQPDEIGTLLDQDTVRRQLSALEGQKADIEQSIAELKARLE